MLVLFGVIPVAMAWSERYAGTTLASGDELVPGGRATLLVVGGGAATLVLRELLLPVLSGSAAAG